MGEPQLIDRLSCGLGVYRYRDQSRPGSPISFGVRADEVAERFPAALGPVVNGVQTVDYTKIVETLR